MEPSGSSSNEAVAAPSSENASAAAAPLSEQTTHEVNIKCIDGSTTKLEVNTDLTGAQLKELIAEKLTVPADQQRLIFRGRAIKDDDVIGAHIRESGQTLHMVQKPAPATPSGTSASSSAARVPGPTGPTVMQTPMGPQVVQFATLPGDFLQGGGDLAQMLSTLLGGAVNAATNAAGQGLPAAVPPVPPESHTAASPASSGKGQGKGTGIASATASRAAGDTSSAPDAAPSGLGAAIQQQVQQLQGQMQIVFQSGELPAGTQPNVLPNMFGSLAQDITRHNSAHPDVETTGAGQPDALPWRDLRRLHAHLSRVLGRSSQHRPAVPPRQMPEGVHGELLAFLSLLHAATSQLSVAISDMQNMLREGNGPASRQRLQFAMVLASSGRVLRAMSTALVPNSLLPMPEAVPEPSTEPALVAEEEPGIGAATDPNMLTMQDPSEEWVWNSVDHIYELRGTNPGGPAPDLEAMARLTGAAAAESSYWPATPSPQEAASEAGAQEDEDDALDVQENAKTEESGPAAIEQTSSASASEQLPTSQANRAAAELDELLSTVTSGSGGPNAEDALASMPANVRSCWEQWTKPDKFRRVLEQAVQPPFSRAYLSGDSTGSHHTPVLPPPEEFLPLRWQRAAGRVQGLREIPEPPDHLSRAYLSAFVRDMGRAVGSDSSYSSMPEVHERYPNLARIVDFVSR
eukprot:TRINITY_DN47267_c0_g1_i1.p1 TRINITY_DN47267_c0_g1~~TRINITY_DN47267_c0_g1_i1.p1  ORF type:complete len:689 (-),score=139.21 TRINITY_DN47267_c0_g1_i1:27-2093(-)